jgi:hypothetical protein
MAGTTQYFGVTYPTSTDYVKDGATAIEAVADGFDAAVAIPTYNTQTGTSYTFALLDAAKVVTSNNASAVTFTIPPQADVVWTTGATLTVANYGAGAVTIAGGSGVTVTNAATTIAQYTSAKLIRTTSNAWTLIPFAGGGANYGTATGGSSSSITDGGISYTLLTFTSSGTLTVTKAGLFDVLIQAASGAGGSTTTTLHSSGGAGGGSVTISTIYLSANQTITLGAGGVAASGANGTTGGKTSLGSILYGIPGAGGPSRSSVVKDGGCGAGTSNGNSPDGLFTAGVGFVGGNGGVSTQDAANGGAGGGAGGNASGTTAGVGITSTFTGSSVTYGTGGGTSGGTAGDANGSGGSGRNNTSSGLGGAGSNAKVFVRFKA